MPTKCNFAGIVGINGDDAGQYQDSETDSSGANGLGQVRVLVRVECADRAVLKRRFGGEVTMKRIVTLTLLSAALFGMAATVSAVQPANEEKPFLIVTTTPDSLELEMSPIAMSADVEGTFTLNVDTNCKLGSIYVETTPLKHQSGASIAPENILVKTSATQGFVAMGKPVAISSPTKGPNKITVDVRVLTKTARGPAGDYSGVFTFIVAPPV